jgi:hypothetical protein
VTIISCHSTDILILNVQMGEEIMPHWYWHFLMIFVRYSLAQKQEGCHIQCLRSLFLKCTSEDCFEHNTFPPYYMWSVQKKTSSVHNNTVMPNINVILIAINAHMKLTASRNISHHSGPFLGSIGSIWFGNIYRYTLKKVGNFPSISESLKIV